MIDTLTDNAMVSIWSSTAVSESILFTQTDPGSPPSSRLLFNPESTPKMTSAVRDAVYELGTDYLWNRETGLLTLPRGSSIPFKTISDLDAQAASGSLDGLHLLQEEVTYTHAPNLWKGYVPVFAEAQLARTIGLLKARAPLRVLLMGDSISSGADASKFIGSPPGLSPFGDQVAEALHRIYGSAITLDNVSVPHDTSGRGSLKVVNENLAARRPDLTIIAYGSNDVALGSMLASRGIVGVIGSTSYAKNIGTIMTTIREQSPDSEFIVVAPMIGNPKLEHFPLEQFVLCRNELQRLVAPGVALADMTAVSEELIKRKSYYEFSSNGINHPNDFGHRLYAQVILGLLARGIA